VNLKSAQTLSKCHRPGNPALQDPQVQKAARMVEATPELKAALVAQVEFDDRHAKILESINPAAGLLDKIDSTLENLQKGFQWSSLRQPPFLAGAIAVLVMIGVLVYVWRGMAENFPGRESTEKMVETIDHMNGMELEPEVTQAGALEDWFFSKGYENFRMLPGFAAMKTVGCRVFKQDGHPVAQVALENHDTILNIFHSADFDVQIDPPERWRLFQQGDWAVAVRSDGDTSFMITFRGKKSDMQDFVNSLH
jgi:hypothetical protein